MATFETIEFRTDKTTPTLGVKGLEILEAYNSRIVPIAKTPGIIQIKSNYENVRLELVGWSQRASGWLQRSGNLRVEPLWSYAPPEIFHAVEERWRPVFDLVIEHYNRQDNSTTIELFLQALPGAALTRTKEVVQNPLGAVATGLGFTDDPNAPKNFFKSIPWSLVIGGILFLMIFNAVRR